MRISLKTKTLATKQAPEQQYSGGGNYQQRDQLLPIHAGKITPKSAGATRDLRKTALRPLNGIGQNTYPCPYCT
jgi:hypothetical protein